MPDTAPRPAGTALAFDFGEKRIGVAVGEHALALAHPLTTLQPKTPDACFSAIDALIREWRPAALVVGRPVALDGAPHAMTERCVHFADQLKARFGLPVVFAEERLSSVEAQRRLRDNGRSLKQSKTCVDALAAQIILQYYFEHMTGSTNEDSTRDAH